MNVPLMEKIDRAVAASSKTHTKTHSPGDKIHAGMPLDELRQFVFTRTGERLSSNELATLGECSRRTAHRWKTIPFYRADIIARNLGAHPIMIWPQWGADCDD